MALLPPPGAETSRPRALPELAEPDTIPAMIFRLRPKRTPMLPKILHRPFLHRAGAVAAFAMVAPLLAAPHVARAQSAMFDNFVEASPRAGETAPDFTLLTLEGEPFHLMEATAEMPVVVEFGSFT